MLSCFRLSSVSAARGRTLQTAVQQRRALSSTKLDASCVLHSSPSSVAAEMRAHKLQRAFVVFDAAEQQAIASHPLLQPLADHFNTPGACADFLKHEGVFLGVGERTGALLSSSVFNTTRGQAAGGVRFWPYATLTGLVTDGLRLSLGMGLKNALAGLWWGGGKGVMCRPNGADDAEWRARGARDAFFQDYGDFVSSLRGVYVTAEDVGVTEPDMNVVGDRTRHTTCISTWRGGSGNPSVFTGYGVAVAMEAACDALQLGGSDGAGVAGRSVSVQGCGNVARPLMQRLIECGVSRIVASDIDAVAVEKARVELAAVTVDGKPHTTQVELRVVAAGDNSSLFEDVDIVAPCALGGSLNADTIPQIKARVVCGAANNQLGNEADDAERFAAAGIFYIPDFLANRMGIVNCADEAAGTMDDDPLIHRHFGRDWPDAIYPVARAVLARAAADGVSTNAAARQLADAKLQEHHPIFPNRSRDLIQALRASNWAAPAAE
jgi:glutamate dehydrogenase/leucine dehydrogenase